MGRLRINQQEQKPETIFMIKLKPEDNKKALNTQYSTTDKYYVQSTDYRTWEVNYLAGLIRAMVYLYFVYFIEPKDYKVVYFVRKGDDIIEKPKSIRGDKLFKKYAISATKDTFILRKIKEMINKI